MRRKARPPQKVSILAERRAGIASCAPRSPLRNPTGLSVGFCCERQSWRAFKVLTAKLPGLSDHLDLQPAQNAISIRRPVSDTHTHTHTHSCVISPFTLVRFRAFADSCPGTLSCRSDVGINAQIGPLNESKATVSRTPAASTHTCSPSSIIFSAPEALLSPRMSCWCHISEIRQQVLVTVMDELRQLQNINPRLIALPVWGLWRGSAHVRA